RNAVRQLTCVELCLRRGEREVPPLVLQPRGAVDELPSRLDLDGHVGELELHGLEPGDRLAELAALMRVRIGEVVCALREADAHRGDGDPAAVEDLQELPEPLATRSE